MSDKKTFIARGKILVRKYEKEELKDDCSLLECQLITYDKDPPDYKRYKKNENSKEFTTVNVEEKDRGAFMTEFKKDFCDKSLDKYTFDIVRTKKEGDVNEKTIIIEKKEILNKKIEELKKEQKDTSNQQRIKDIEAIITELDTVRKGLEQKKGGSTRKIKKHTKGKSIKRN